MGAGNPRFSEMERYSPETYYVEAYDYDMDWDDAFNDFTLSIADNLVGMGMRMNVSLERSDDVDMCGRFEEALTMFDCDMASVCVSTESSPDKIIVTIVPISYERYAYGLRDDYDESLVEKSYDEFIDNEFELMRRKFVRLLYDAFDGKVYYPLGAWCSGKIEF